MTVERLRDVLATTPFRPFTILMADGRNLAVRHRECVAYQPANPRTVVVIDGDDQVHIVEMLLISELEVEPLVGSGKA